MPVESAEIIERLPEIPVSCVKVGDRFRRDMGDIEDLCKSIEAQGLLQPIVVDENLNLICGERRLLAFKQLGLSLIPARVLDLPDLLLAEVDENRCRKDFSPSEAVEIGRKLEAIVATPKHVKAEHRDPENYRISESGDTRDKVGQAVGLSGRTYEKAKTVVEAAEAEPEKFGHLISKMDSGEVSIHRADAFVQNARLIEATNERIATVAPPQGVYRCVVIDPPWPMAKIQRDCRPNQAKELDYPTMSIEDIAALPVPTVLDPAGCHVYLWVTQKYLPDGLKLFEAWGIKYQCCLTWVKPVGFTPFSWMYNTEHVLFGRVGNLGLQQMGRIVKNRCTVRFTMFINKFSEGAFSSFTQVASHCLETAPCRVHSKERRGRCPLTSIVPRCLQWCFGGRQAPWQSSSG